MIFQSDINECVGMNECDSNATCTDVAGSFTCTCNQGYTGNGTTCTGEYTISTLLYLRGWNKGAVLYYILHTYNAKPLISLCTNWNTLKIGQGLSLSL